MFKCDSVSTEVGGRMPFEPDSRLLMWPKVTIVWWSIAHPTPEDQVVLCTEERQRASRFVAPGAAGRFIAARAGLRRQLAQLLDMGPRELRFEYGPQGKPCLPEVPDLYFNLSHSGDWAVLAHSRQHRVGVDVETLLGPRRIGPNMLQMTLTPPERARLEALPLAAQRSAFTRYWTAKEAVMKLSGLGMYMPPTALQFDLDSLKLQLDPCWRAAVPTATRVQALQAPDGMMATLAAAVVGPHAGDVPASAAPCLPNSKRHARLEISTSPVV